MAKRLTIVNGFSYVEISEIMEKDATVVTSNLEAYVGLNRRKYDVITHTWLYMCAEFVPARSVRALRNMILRDGLLSVIGRCSDLASDIVRSDFKLSDLGELGFMMHEDPRITLQLLRYPKRFSPSGADKVLEKGIQAFIAINNKAKGHPTVIDRETGKVLERTLDYPRFLINGVKAFCALLLDVPIHESAPLTCGSFSSGVTALGSKTKYEKYLEFAAVEANYKGVLYPIGRFDIAVGTQSCDYVKAVAVPKNYKQPRIIAEVDAYTQFGQQGIRRALTICVSSTEYGHLMTLNDQTHNQEASRLGSVYGTYATIDLSSASDSISDHLARQILPECWYDVANAWNPKSIMIRGKMWLRYIFLTSGSGDTFGFETVIFLSIALFATSYVRLFLEDDEEDLLDPRAFGDDIICDVRVVDTLYDFLEMLGFSVNKEKSFSSESRYRESCGAEWWCGLDTATKYFPRKAFDETSPEFLQALISLQHRLFEFSDAETWLTNYINDFARTFFKKDARLTSSYPGTECADLWDDIPFFSWVRPPYDHDSGYTPNAEWNRESHSALVPKPFSPKKFPDLFKDRYKRSVTQRDYQLCEMIRYVDWLQWGYPRDDYGCIVYPPRIEDDFLIRESVWTSVKR